MITFPTASLISLSYEEKVLLQEIMVDVHKYIIDAGVVYYDKSNFDSLNEKIMST